MKFGILKEIKNGEFRVTATPAEVSVLVGDGHQVYVTHNAGYAAGFDDAEYEAAGAVIKPENRDLWEICDFVAKVKEIEPSEYEYLRENQMIYCCVHPAGHPEEVNKLLEKKVIAITAEDSHRYGSPNCEAAGKAGAFMGLWSMFSFNGGSGKFASGLAGAPGVNALVCGCGTVGKAAVEVLTALGCCVTVSDISIGLLRDIQQKYNGKINTIMSNRANLAAILPTTDLVINSVRWPKNAKDFMIDREMVRSMRRGSVIVDISNDYGCIETFHETTHDNPTYIEEGVVHYCVGNIPGAVSRTSTIALTNATLRYGLEIAGKGLEQAVKDNPAIALGVNTYDGKVTCKNLADSFDDVSFTDILTLV